MNQTAYFMLPGFYEHLDIYKLILEKIKQKKYYLKENREIYCLYGNIPFCTWDGGRVFYSYQPASYEEMEFIKYLFNEVFQIKLRFVFTNNLIKEEDCYDRYNNTVLQIFDNGMNEIVINSPILEKYIRTFYPNYKIISSTTKCLDKESTKEELNNENYHLICLDYNLNHNMELLNNLSPEEKNKVEFLVNPVCGPGCSNRKEHYRLNSLYSLTYGKEYKLKNCIIKEGIFYPEPWPTRIYPNEIENYVNNDFHYFKLEGRTMSHLTILMIFAQYLIKDEYQFTFISEIYNQYLEEKK